MPQFPDSARTAAGFTLIETIVALVILSSVLIVFYNFVSTLMQGAGRAETASTAYDHRTNALELAATLNPMTIPQGTFDLGTYRVRWTSKRIGQIRQSSRYPAGRGTFKVALYRVTLSFPGDNAIAPVTVTRLGYRRRTLPPPVISSSAANP